MNHDIGIYDTVTADYILAAAKSRLGLTSTTTKDVDILNYINLGIGMLSTNFTYPTKAIVPISYSNGLGIAQTPKGLSKLISVQLVASFNTGSEPIISSESFSVELTNGFLYFGSTVTSPYCLIKYFTTNLDETGELKIPAIAFPALLAFCCKEFLLDNERLDAKYQVWARRWSDAKQYIRGKMNSPDGLDLEKISWILSTF